MKIKVGSDELILWIRKNNIAMNTPNDGIGGLGRFIYDIIVELGGSKIMDHQESYWDIRSDSKNISEIQLPKTSAQYEIDVNVLPKIYEKIIGLKQKNGI